MLGWHIFKVPQSKTPKPILQLPSQRRHKSERFRISWSIFQEHVFLGMVFKLLNLSISLSLSVSWEDGVSVVSVDLWFLFCLEIFLCWEFFWRVYVDGNNSCVTNNTASILLLLLLPSFCRNEIQQNMAQNVFLRISPHSNNIDRSIWEFETNPLQIITILMHSIIMTLRVSNTGWPSNKLCYNLKSWGPAALATSWLMIQSCFCVLDGDLHQHQQASKPPWSCNVCQNLLRDLVTAVSGFVVKEGIPVRCTWTKYYPGKWHSHLKTFASLFYQHNQNTVPYWEWEAARRAVPIPDPSLDSSNTTDLAAVSLSISSMAACMYNRNWA